MTTSLITGGSGFIGSHIAEALLSKGHRVVILDNLVTGKMDNMKPWFNRQGCEFHQVDVSDYSAIRQHFPGVDYVFHNAASKCTVCAADPKKDLMVNALGTLNVIQAAHECGAKKVIHASTGSVNQINSYYGNSKNAGENYLRVFKNYHPDFTYSVLRYHHVYGPRQDSSDRGGVIPIFIRKIAEGEPITIFGDGKQTRHFTHVRDVVDANVFCMEKPSTNNKAFDLIPDRFITINELARLLGKEMGRSVRIERKAEKPGDIREFSATSGDIVNLGCVFKVELEDGLRETIRWYLGEGRVAA